MLTARYQSTHWFRSNTVLQDWASSSGIQAKPLFYASPLFISRKEMWMYDSHWVISIRHPCWILWLSLSRLGQLRSACWSDDGDKLYIATKRTITVLHWPNIDGKLKEFHTSETELDRYVWIVLQEGRWRCSVRVCWKQWVKVAHFSAGTTGVIISYKSAMINRVRCKPSLRLKLGWFL